MQRHQQRNTKRRAPPQYLLLILLSRLEDFYLLFFLTLKVPMIVPPSSISSDLAQRFPAQDSIPLSLATVQREMAQPPPQRYFTSDGLPPNNGVPFQRSFVGAPAVPQPGPSIAVPPATQPAPKRYYTSDGKPPNNGFPIDESSTESSEEQLLVALLGRLRLRMQTQACVTATTPEPATKDVNSFVQEDILYLFPEKHTNIYFLYAGQRPCDFRGLWTQNFPYKHVKLPLSMTVGEMASRLGNPGRDLQEMVELIQPVSDLSSCTHIDLLSCFTCYLFLIVYLWL